MADTSEEVAPGITSLSQALSLSIALLDGDATAIAAAEAKSYSNDKSKNNGSSEKDAPTTTDIPPVERAIAILTKLQTQISHSGIISTNETLDDVSTLSLELVSVEYQLGRAYLMLPTYPSPSVNSNDVNGNGSSHTSSVTSNGPSPSILRKQNVTRAMEYYHSFLKKLEQLGDDMLQPETLKEYHSMLDLQDMNSTDNGSSNSSVLSAGPAIMNPSQIRQLKIQRYQRKKSTIAKRQQLTSQLQRRTRLELPEEETLDGYDADSLMRTINIETLRMYAEESLEELQSSQSELEMLDMSIKMERSRVDIGGDVRMNRMPSSAASSGGGGSRMSGGYYDPRQQQQPKGPMQMTQITQNPVTGELIYTKQHISNGQIQPIPQQAQTTIRRQDIAEGVFKPSWNQPTMTLAELGEIERNEAIARSEAQKLAEAENVFKPKRYDQLVKDGMEDNAELVEASAKLDRDWDDWKDENPRGSGNKNSERGDRNF